MDEAQWNPLASRVYYAAGLAFREQKLLHAALNMFGEVVERFAGTAAAPEALLESAECLAELGRSDESRVVLGKVLSSYPGSEAAKTAKERLKEPELVAPPPPPLWIMPDAGVKKLDEALRRRWSPPLRWRT